MRGEKQEKRIRIRIRIRMTTSPVKQQKQQRKQQEEEEEEEWKARGTAGVKTVTAGTTRIKIGLESCSVADYKACTQLSPKATLCS